MQDRVGTRVGAIERTSEREAKRQRENEYVIKPKLEVNKRDVTDKIFRTIQRICMNILVKSKKEGIRIVT